jgi:hypothetical protein
MREDKSFPIKNTDLIKTKYPQYGVLGVGWDMDGIFRRHTKAIS